MYICIWYGVLFYKYANAEPKKHTFLNFRFLVFRDIIKNTAKIPLPLFPNLLKLNYEKNKGLVEVYLKLGRKL